MNDRANSLIIRGLDRCIIDMFIIDVNFFDNYFLYVWILSTIRYWARFAFLYCIPTSASPCRTSFTPNVDNTLISPDFILLIYTINELPVIHFCPKNIIFLIVKLFR